jgi:hypothetical protein
MPLSGQASTVMFTTAVAGRAAARGPNRIRARNKTGAACDESSNHLFVRMAIDYP